MRYPVMLAVCFGLLFGTLLRADTTVRMKNTVTVGPQIPASLIAQFKALGMPAMPDETLMLVQGQRTYISGQPFAYLYDYANQRVILIDSAHHQYVSLPIQDLPQVFAPQATGAPPASTAAMQQAMKGMHVQVDSSTTGQPDTILGIAVSESEFTIAMSMDPAATPGAPASLMAMGPMTLFRLRFQMWRVTPDALKQRPDLRALSANTAALSEASNLPGELQKLGASLPGVGDKLAAIVQQMASNPSPVLRFRLNVDAPFLAQMAQLAAHAGQPPPASAEMNSNAPLVELTSEAVGISHDRIDPARLQVTADSQPVALDAFLKTAMPPPNLPALGGQGVAGRCGPCSASRTAPAAVDAGKPIPATDLLWFDHPGEDSAALLANPQFIRALPELAPSAEYHYHLDMPLQAAFLTILTGRPHPVQEHNGRYLITSAGGSPGALLWVDRQDGLAIGGIVFQPGNGEPTPSLTLFSNQLGGSITRLSQLPAAFAADLSAWSEDGGAPELVTRYFINAQGVKTVLAHDEDFCQSPGFNQRHKTPCGQMNLDDARLDLAAVEYLEARAGQPAPDNAAWQQQLRAACGDTPDATCELRTTRARVELLQNGTP